MKFAAVLFALAAAVASTNAATCTEAQLSSSGLESSATAVQTACGPLMQTVSGGASFDPKAFCEKSACLKSLEDATNVMPDCVAQGMNLKSTYSSLIDKIHDQCKKAGASSPAAPSAALGAPAAALAATAAIAVFAQL